MGYDMRFVTCPEGEAERVSAAQELFYKACDVRKSVPDEERGTLDRRNWDQIPDDASPRYKAAQRTVDAAYELLQHEEASYFRLNIWGMSHYHAAMAELGMVYRSRSPHFPDPATYHGNAVEDELWWGAVEHFEHGEALPEGLGAEMVEAARRYAADCLETRRRHPDLGQVIPEHKFGSNDGWVVTPEEIRAALAVYEATPAELVNQVVGTHIGDGERRDYWDRWIAYLRLAVSHDGFEVH